MNSGITFYPTAADIPKARMSGTSGHLYLDCSAYSPSLLIDMGDQEYLRRLAKAATELADRMDANTGGAA